MNNGGTRQWRHKAVDRRPAHERPGLPARGAAPRVPRSGVDPPVLHDNRVAMPAGVATGVAALATRPRYTWPMSTPNVPSCPHVLALDTSTQSLHVGVLRGDTAAEVVRELPGGAAGSETLIAALVDVLDQAGLRLDQVQAIAVGRGPGAFTGVRTACAVAQGLALGLGLPVLPIDTLQAVAEDARALLASAAPGGAMPALCCVAMDARMGELYCALYELAPQGVSAERWPAQLMTPQQLLERLRPHERQAFALAGNAVDVHAQALAPLLGHASLCVADARPRASALLRLARRAWQAGRSQDAAQALPLYVRDKVALTTEEREAARAAAVHGSTQAAP